ncbi:glutelin [Musa troglodytarum]|uniref:Glutelin n=1 Tax=Musa troglodytarum TaxID=320322 RepID=A0A9E7L3K3_9LILI|nr:glutelin [Musa troglodytarum]
MATSASVVLSFSLCLLLLCHISRAQLGLGQLGAGEPWMSGHRYSRVSQCRIEKLSALELTRRVPSEAGYTEYFDQFNEQLQCVGVAASRRTIQPRGLLLPTFSSAPRLVYILDDGPWRMQEGESLEQCSLVAQRRSNPSSKPSNNGSRWQADVRGSETSTSGSTTSVRVTSSRYPPELRIELQQRRSGCRCDYHLRHEQHRQSTGSPAQVEQGSQIEVRLQQIKGNNLLSGFELDPLAEALGVDRELVRKIQNLDDRRGEIVRVASGLQVLQASWMREQEVPQPEREPRQECQEGRGCQSNLLEVYCTLKITQNIGDPRLADYFNPRAGRITTSQSDLAPNILRFVQMSANAIRSPHWNVNAHSIVYALRGYSRVQVVGHRGQTVFVGELRQGQLLVVPQYFAMMFQAQRETFEWVSIKTNDNAMVNHFVGKTSALRGMPVEVLMNSYCISREEAMQLKFNRGNELALFTSKIEREAIKTSV